MRMRKMAVRISSSVRTQAGRGGLASRAEDVEVLLLVTLLEADPPELATAGGDRDTSCGLAR